MLTKLRKRIISFEFLLGFAQYYTTLKMKLVFGIRGIRPVNLCSKKNSGLPPGV